LLETLPDEVYKDGCAEVIKHGVIADKALFNSYATPVNAQFEEVIARNVAIKGGVVAEDEFENGKRKLLNFGHTVGHAIEVLSGYETSHGNAVAAGMAIETRAAHKMGICDEDCVSGMEAMLERYDLPATTEFGVKELAQACLADKKRDGGKITMIFPTEIGRCVLKDVSVVEVEAVIRMGME